MPYLQFTKKPVAQSPIQKAIDNKLDFQKKPVLPVKKEEERRVNPRAIPNQTYA